MNSKILAVTRALLSAAAAVTSFIVKHSAKITAAATVIHSWALKKAAQLADKRVERAYKQYDNATTLVTTARKLQVGAGDTLNKVADERDLVAVAVRAELAQLSA